MNKPTRLRALAMLMCSTTLTTVLCLLGTSTTVHASNCCQDCEEIDATCATTCQQACGSDEFCLSMCYDSCDAQSAGCWGMQGHGPYCTWCSYGGNGTSYFCLGTYHTHSGGGTWFRIDWCFITG